MAPKKETNIWRLTALTGIMVAFDISRPYINKVKEDLPGVEKFLNPNLRNNLFGWIGLVYPGTQAIEVRPGKYLVKNSDYYKQQVNCPIDDIVPVELLQQASLFARQILVRRK